MRIPTTAYLVGALTLFNTLPAHGVGSALDVQIVDRGTGATLVPIFHDGEWWVAGRPGARYGVTIDNLVGRRTLNVFSVDGVNAISGQTAAWSQTGYVLDPYQQAEFDGWRKNNEQVAAFTFTALPDSYAARTGRATNVGVISIAMFNEKTSIPTTGLAPSRSRRPMAPPAIPAPMPPKVTLAHPSPRPELDAAEPSSEVASVARRQEPLGTGHGAIEASRVTDVAFERARTRPDEIVTIHYDRIENLIAKGIVPMPPVAANLPDPAANPFPDGTRFVPDPPRRR